MMDDAHAIVKVMVEKALDGGSSAAGLILARVAPALKAQAERVQFDFDAKAPLACQVEQVLQAVAAGGGVSGRGQANHRGDWQFGGNQAD